MRLNQLRGMEAGGPGRQGRRRPRHHRKEQDRKPAPVFRTARANSQGSQGGRDGDAQVASASQPQRGSSYEL